MATSKQFVIPTAPKQAKPPTPEEAFAWQETKIILETLRAIEVRTMLHLSQMTNEQRSLVHEGAVRLYSITEVDNAATNS